MKLLLRLRLSGTRRLLRGTLSAGGFDESFGEYILPYSEVRTSDDPEGTLLTFLDETYARAADLADWDRKNLEVNQDRLLHYLPPNDIEEHRQS